MLRVEARSGEALHALVAQFAQLRIEVFRDWPYLYDGNFAYEQSYLARFLEAPHHIAICAFDGEALVGASTAAPLASQHEEVAAPFSAAGERLEDIFYFGESILKRAYRGKGLGHAFFDGREAHAAALGYTKMAFCGVIRPDDHPARPLEHRPLDAFWRKRGYRPLGGVIAHFSWLDVGDAEESAKPMQFWGRGFG